MNILFIVKVKISSVHEVVIYIEPPNHAEY